jgi:hypothetical protein
MLTRADLDEAVRSGIITEQQSVQLLRLPEQRRQARHAHAQGDERFVFMKSFNEFFIALGVVLLGVGLWAAASSFPGLGSVFPVLFIAVMWGLAEFLTRKLKLTLPSIVLAIFIVTTLAFVLKDSLSDSNSLLLASLSAAVSAALFYWRFRLPFALLLLAGACVASVFALFTALIGEPTQSFTYALFLIAGLVVLIAAQWYDTSDRQRLTRRSDCAFWLTLIAASLIVHPIAGLISSGEDTTPQSSLLTIAVVILFALVALIIDRRAFLVSSLAYLGGAMVYALTRIGGEQNALWITLLLMGASVILLGVGWHRARRAVMQFIPSSLARYLPVVRA